VRIPPATRFYLPAAATARWRAQLIKQLFLRQTVGNDREHIAVNKRRVARQFTRERRFRPAFDFGSDHALLKRHRFRIGFQTDWPDGDTQRFTGLAQHPA
jgi:hypothetical protein